MIIITYKIKEGIGLAAIYKVKVVIPSENLFGKKRDDTFETLLFDVAGVLSEKQTRFDYIEKAFESARFLFNEIRTQKNYRRTTK